METIYIILANLVLAAHVGYVSFVVIGQLAIMIGAVFKWEWIRNRWFRLIHLLAITIVAVEAFLGVTCPLTIWENQLRELAGQETVEGDFIAHMLHQLIFLQIPDDHWIFKVMYYGFAALVVITLFVVPPRWKKEKRPSQQTNEAANEAGEKGSEPS